VWRRNSATTELIIAHALAAPRANRRPWVSPTQIVAQCRAGIFLLKQTAVLKLGHQQTHYIIIGTRHARRRQHKPVAGWCGKPFLHLIGNLLGIAPKHRVLLDRAAAGDRDEIAHCRVLFGGMPDHPVAEPLKR